MSRFSRISETEGMREESPEETAAFFLDPTRIHYIILMVRDRVDECLKTLEREHFTSGTPRGDLFHLRFIEWKDLPWIVASIPYGERDKMERVAAAHGLRVASGVPHVFDAGGPAAFPVSNARTFTLEYASSHSAVPE